MLEWFLDLLQAVLPRIPEESFPFRYIFFFSYNSHLRRAFGRRSNEKKKNGHWFSGSAQRTSAELPGFQNRRAGSINHQPNSSSDWVQQTKALFLFLFTSDICHPYSDILLP
jgi:hypothetical protein